MNKGRWYTSFTGSLLNCSKTGLDQRIKGHFDEKTDIWIIDGIIYEVKFPITLEGVHIYRKVSQELGFHIDWNKVYDLTLEKLENEEIESAQIEKESIEQILSTLGVLEKRVNPNVIINGAPQTIYVISPDYKVELVDPRAMEIVDVEPIVEVPDKVVEDE